MTEMYMNWYFPGTYNFLERIKTITINNGYIQNGQAEKFIEKARINGWKIAYASNVWNIKTTTKPLEFDETTIEEINYFMNIIQLLRSYLKNYPLSTIILDCEREANTSEEKWARSFRIRTIESIFQSAFPNTPIIWFTRAGYTTTSDSSFENDRWFSDYDKETTNIICGALYTPQKMQQTYDGFTLNKNLSQETNKQLALFISLGAGLESVWISDLEYNNHLSYFYGSLTKLFNVDYIIFYPSAGDTRTPTWAEHFDMYIKGYEEKGTSGTAGTSGTSGSSGTSGI